MSGWVRALVFVFVGTFGTLAVIFALHGDFKAAAGALVLAILASPLLLEAWQPGKYVLRKPESGASDNLMNRLKQFRVDHPGVDGTFILGGVVVLMLLLGGSALVSAIRSLVLP